MCSKVISGYLLLLYTACLINSRLVGEDDFLIYRSLSDDEDLPATVSGDHAHEQGEL